MNYSNIFQNVPLETNIYKNAKSENYLTSSGSIYLLIKEMANR